MKIYIKVTQDNYEFIEATADSAREMAEMFSVPISNVHSSVHRWKKYKQRTPFRLVEVDDED